MENERDYTRGHVAWEAVVSNAELIQVVTRVARASWRELSIVHGIAPRDMAEAAYTYVQRRTRYRAEHGDQYVRTPWAFVRDKRGDCKSTATFIASLARRHGQPTVLRFVTWHGATEPGHVYAVVNGIPADPLLPYGVEAVYLRRQDHHL